MSGQVRHWLGVTAVTWHGVAGLSKSTTGGHGVYGKNTTGGTGIVGESDGWMGVYGLSKSTTGGAGVMGDKRVAGVISGAGNYKPGIVLDKQQSGSDRKQIALLGKVYCKVDASYAPIGVGDLLTTAPTPGHAMKATDPLKAFGSVIGKALRPLREGQGLIPILIALR